MGHNLQSFLVIGSGSPNYWITLLLLGFRIEWMVTRMYIKCEELAFMIIIAYLICSLLWEEGYYWFDI